MKLFELDQTLYSNEGKRIRQKINEDGTKQDIKFCKKMHSTESKIVRTGLLKKKTTSTNINITANIGPWLLVIILH